MSRFMYVYKTTNAVNGKIYIGQCTRRFTNQYIGSGTELLLAVKEHGRSNFTVEVLEWCTCQDELNEQEQYWIRLYESTLKNVGYNITSGGQQGGVGWSHGLTKHTHTGLAVAAEKAKNRIRLPHTDETKRKMSESARGRKKSEQHIENMKIAFKGRIPWNKGLSHNVNDIPEVKAKLECAVYSKRRGKTMDEIYGVDRASEIRKKHRDSWDRKKYE